MNINPNKKILSIQEADVGWIVEARGTGEDLLLMLSALTNQVAKKAQIPPQIMAFAIGAAASELDIDSTEIDMSHLAKYMRGGATDRSMN